MTMPVPKEGTVRSYAEKFMTVHEVYQRGRWVRLKPEEVRDAMKSAPVVIAGKSDMNPSGEAIKLPPPPVGNR